MPPKAAAPLAKRPITQADITKKLERHIYIKHLEQPKTVPESSEHSVKTINPFEDPLFQMIVKNNMVSLALRKVHQKQADELNSFTVILKALCKSGIALSGITIPSLLFATPFKVHKKQVGVEGEIINHVFQQYKLEYIMQKAD